jgi:hypothetical protein
MERMPRSTGCQRTDPRRFLRPWEPRLAVIAGVVGSLAGPLAPATVFAAQPAGSGPFPTPPATAAALGTIAITLLAWLMLAARRYRQRKPTPATDVELAAADPGPRLSELDLDLLLAAPGGRGGAGPDGRGSQAVDGRPEEPGSGGRRSTVAPVWVRRLDGRIPIMPTHQNVPIDDDPGGRRRTGGARPQPGRGGD